MRYRVFAVPEPLTGQTIVYIPGLRKVYLVPRDRELPGFVEASTETAETPPAVPLGQFTAVQFTVNQKCNFACLYCYADAQAASSPVGPFQFTGQGPAEISWPVAKVAIDRVVSDSTASGKLRFQVMMAGGEPTLSMDIVRQITAYAREEAAANQLRASIGLVTNGCFSNSVCRWIIDSLDYVTVSIDGDRESHNRQRPTIGGFDAYGRILRNATKIHRSGQITLGLRLTVTALNVDRLPELVLYLGRQFPGRRIGFEPVQDCGRCTVTNQSSPSLVPDDSVLCAAMLQTMSVARRHNIPLKSSLLTFKSPNGSLSFCGVDGRNFSVDPEGYISSCTRVTSRFDPLATHFQYGRVNVSHDLCDIDVQRFDRVCALNVRRYPECQDCFAQYNCKGDCAHIRLAHQPSAESLTGPRCRFVRNLTLGILQQQLGLRG